jgi:hypothetical protein
MAVCWISLEKPYTHEEIEPVMKYVRDHYRPWDFLYLYEGTVYAFKYYQERYEFTNEGYIVGHDLSQWKSHVDDPKKISGNKRVWILFSHLSKRGRVEEDTVVSQLDSMGTRLDAFKHIRAAVYLYDLTASMPPSALVNSNAAP